MEYKTEVTMNGTSWQCAIHILDKAKNYIKASIAYRGSEYVLCVMRYFHHGLLGSEYGLFVPADDFGCRVSKDSRYNYSQVSKHTAYEVDRYSEVAALQVILSLFD